MPDGKSSKRKEYIAKWILISIYLGGFALFIGWMLFYGPGFGVFNIGALDVVLLGLATFRMGHLLSYDRVMEPLRHFFTETVPDATGAGDSVEPKGEGFQQALGQLLCCPICSGTWAAALMVYGLYLWPGPARVFLLIMAAVGIAEFLNSAGEFLSWGGQYARTMSGSINLARQEQQKNEQILTERELRFSDRTRDELRVEEGVFSRRVEK